MSLDVDLNPLVGLDFKVELPCEHSKHLVDHIPVQAGAAWVQHTVCPGCDTEWRVLVCDYWKRSRETWQNDFYRCPECNLGYPGFLWKLEFTPISEVDA